MRAAISKRFIRSFLIIGQLKPRVTAAKTNG